MDIRKIKLDISNSKPGRTLTQWSIDEIGEILGEAPLFPYLVRLRAGGQPAGNHYHHLKKEFFLCIEGELEVVFEDIETKERTSVMLHADSSIPSPSENAFVVPTHIPHAVKNIGTSTASLLVFATRKAREPEDDFEYQII